MKNSGVINIKGLHVKNDKVKKMSGLVVKLYFSKKELLKLLIDLGGNIEDLEALIKKKLLGENLQELYINEMRKVIETLPKGTVFSLEDIIKIIRERDEEDEEMKNKTLDKGLKLSIGRIFAKQVRLKKHDRIKILKRTTSNTTLYQVIK